MNSARRFSAILISISISIALGVVSSVARADSNDASCEVRKDHHTKEGASGPCTFSQRQGYIDIDLRNGKSYSLSPGEKSDHFKDQKGHKVLRTQAGGGTQEFKWEGGQKIVVTFGGSSSGSGGSSGGSERVAVGDMGRYCVGEASAKFNQRPGDVSTQNPAKDKGMYSVWGQYPSRPSPQVFICTFASDGRFVGVDKYNP